MRAAPFFFITPNHEILRVVPLRLQLLQVARLGDLDAAAGGGVGLLGALGHGVVDLVLGGFGLFLEGDLLLLGDLLGADLELGLVEDGPVAEGLGVSNGLTGRRGWWHKERGGNRVK